MTNSLGQKVCIETKISVTENWQGTFDVQEYTSGIYFVTVADENQKLIETIQFLKK